ncbi:hypothetical protein FISHEDRAFT_75807 [Fistulina hepatica ATCC 64428]|uniref:DNA/RNA polymerase n=1 Tax=Fistulina hepatica ATCC 64428 TaxID=1128425 RepID=A0A0D7A5E8_9AGAR|nr:hypothetical protein FISHEDRAFT_75807 [Fistulina hepatica ATCC 64428]
MHIQRCIFFALIILTSLQTYFVCLLLKNQTVNRNSPREWGVHTEAIAACESIVERFRAGTISKARAIIEIQHQVPFSGKFDDEEQLTAHSTVIGSFLRKLDSFERIRGIAESQSSEREAEASTLGRERSTADDHQPEENEGPTLKRARVQSDDEEAEDVLSVSRKLDVARLPWNARKQSRAVEDATVSAATSRADDRVSSILRTVETLEVINVDLKRAKINLLLSLDVPQFPDSQWTKLLSGGTADFDQVLSGLYAAADVERTTERIGGLEFSYISTSPAKRVSTFGDWTTAFDCFADAFIFIFPHRADELRMYASHVKSFFKARPQSEHSGVIVYDSAVRTRVGQRLPAQARIQQPLAPLKPVACPVEESGVKVGRPAVTTTTASALAPAPPVITPTSVANVEPEGMWRRIAKRSEEFLWRYTPKYARSLMWFSSNEEENPPKKESLADTSLTLKPVPEPPVKESTNVTAVATITHFPHLFPIVTPVNVDEFEALLRDHPNHSLVQSVCRSLCEGFWPWASTANRDYPDTYDNAEGYRMLTDPAHIAFAHKQFAAEIAAGRFSPSFGSELLPGMYGVPVWVVPKPHSDGLRLVVDHSAGKYSLNSMIPKPERSVHLDGLQQLGKALISAKLQHPHRRLVIWKSDVSHAYRILPMHPLWQLKQMVKIDNTRHVDFDNNFGGGGSGRIWSIFFALVLWIATYIMFVLDLFAYVDDTFSWDFADDLVWYEPYRALYPHKQTILLRLWDRLGIPHERRKQEWGYAVIVIGLLVDADEMSVTMPDQSRHELIAALHAFAIPGQRRPLVEFQRLGGWINWVLNVYPLLRPGLSILYAKTRDKTQPFQAVWVSKALCSELRWITSHLETSSGVYILKSRRWGPSEADVVAFTDASHAGMLYYLPSSHSGFQCHTELLTPPPGISRDHIFYFEALAVLSAIVHVLSTPNPPPRLLVWTDNTNTVDMFNSLHALPPYNPLLITAVDLLMHTDCQLRVLHVSGADNRIADALSRFQNSLAIHLSPHLHIASFRPLRLTSGVAVL